MKRKSGRGGRQTVGEAVAVNWVERDTKRGRKMHHVHDNSVTLPSCQVSRTDDTSKHEATRWQIDDAPEIDMPLAFDIDYVIPELPERKKVKSQNDYLREWLPKREEYLDQLLAEEAQFDMNCRSCGKHGSWRCIECFGRPILCNECCRDLHMFLPFHRVEVWSDTHFEPAWLRQAGVVLHFGHRGLPCPKMTEYDYQDRDEVGSMFRGGFYSDDEGSDDHRCFSDEGQYFELRPEDPPHEPGSAKSPTLLIVDTSGLHHIPVHFCMCPGHRPPDLQVMEMGLFPASFTRVRTAFTFRVLDDFRLDNLESNTTQYDYFAKLRRVTSPGFPHTVPNRYREFVRVERAWRNLKIRKWSGLGHEPRTPLTGEMATFCPACPQPGINLPEDWQSDPNRVVFTRSLVFDGNFSQSHLKQKRPDDDVWLTAGEGMMTERTRYEKHLQVAIEVKERSTCHDYRAIGEKEKGRAGCDVTGIGAGACSRHGFFVPGSCVDFQKGERQMNMDYSLSEALKTVNLGPIRDVIVFYDIMCQYSKKLEARFNRNQYLNLPEGIRMIPGIGLFHVHGHQPGCLVRYAPSFIKGAGQVDGEIIETLWARLNGTAQSTRTASLAHRAEVLDDHMNDSNWKKLVSIVSRVCQKYGKAVVELAKHKEAFEALDATRSKEEQQEWKAQADKADRERLHNIQIMDNYESKQQKLPTKAEIQARLYKEEQQICQQRGVTSWIANGLKIQDHQILLQSFAQKVSAAEGTSIQIIELSQRREKLEVLVEAFQKQAHSFLPVVDIPDEEYDIPDPISGGFNKSFSSDAVENTVLLLPSALGYQACMAANLSAVVEKEIQLRQGQANDALQGVRLAIGQKAFLFCKRMRTAPSKVKKAAVWDDIHLLDTSLKHHRKVYNMAIKAMHNLGAAPDIIARYKPLTDEDLKASTVLINSNERGHRNDHLPWFWRLNVNAEEGESDILMEFYRVHWLRAYAQYQRWEEELAITEHEMEWVKRYFLYRAARWAAWRHMAEERQQLGHMSYASRQQAMWERFAVQAEKYFEATKMSSTRNSTDR